MKAFRFSLRTGIVLFLVASLLSGVGVYYYKYKACTNYIASWDEYGGSNSGDPEFFEAHGEMGVWALRDALTSTRPYVQSRVLKSLRYLGPKARSAVPDLIKALDNFFTVYRAVEALGAIGPDALAAVPKLKELAVNGDYCSFDPYAPEVLEREGQNLRRDPPVIRKLAQEALANIAPEPTKPKE